MRRCKSWMGRTGGASRRKRASWTGCTNRSSSGARRDPETSRPRGRPPQRFPHPRVAYALGLKRVNILSGKVNRVDFGEGQSGYCYYFEVSSLLPGEELHPRDLEALILD